LFLFCFVDSLPAINPPKFPRLIVTKLWTFDRSQSNLQRLVRRPPVPPFGSQAAFPLVVIPPECSWVLEVGPFLDGMTSHQALPLVTMDPQETFVRQGRPPIHPPLSKLPFPCSTIPPARVSFSEFFPLYGSWGGFRQFYFLAPP